ncbi:MAG: RNA polymerase sigma factor, partial [Brevundimonas sp.]
MPAQEIDEVDRRLQAHVRGRVGSRQDAEDIAQESWARITAAVQSDRAAIDNVRGYLFRIARNLIVDHRRRAASTIEVKADDALLD